MNMVFEADIMSVNQQPLSTTLTTTIPQLAACIYTKYNWAREGI